MRTVLQLSVILLIAVITVLSTNTYHGGAASSQKQANVASAINQNQQDIEAIIAYRREYMKALSAHYRSLEAIIGNSAPFESHALDHVNALTTLAQHMDASFPPGTTMLESEGWGALPSIWEEPESFTQIINDFQVSLKTLQVVITSQDQGPAPVNALDQVRQHCLACHQQYRVRKS